MKKRLYNPTHEQDSCGVGFLTRKDGVQTHDVISLVHQALCKIPHRGGMNAEGVGDGAGVNIDISENFYRHLTGQDLKLGQFGVGNFFVTRDENHVEKDKALIAKIFEKHALKIILWRDVPVNNDALNDAGAKAQLPIIQVVFINEKGSDWETFEREINFALLDIERTAFTSDDYDDFYPISLSSRTQVYKGRLNSWEVIPYFEDLSHPEHHVNTLFFHTRFSTNTAPNPWFAQPFRRMAHNGELNTDRKNRLSEDAIARHGGKSVIFPAGQSDSARLDQTLQRRYLDDSLDIDKALLAMMPPAWENDSRFSDEVRDMLEYFSLYEEKNDGPAAIVFSDGLKVGARLDRLGLRPLRSVETSEYLGVMSEAGQIDFPPDDVIRRGRIEAGGMIMFDHAKQELLTSQEILTRMAQEKDYSALLKQARINLSELPEANDQECEAAFKPALPIASMHVGYSLNQESFKFMLDPMLTNGMEKISAMGYGIAPNALAGDEGGLSRYFLQRFAQVTNPPLDSIREADGMTLRVSLGGKPYFVDDKTSKQVVLNSPILQPKDLLKIEKGSAEGLYSCARIDALYPVNLDCADKNQAALEQALKSVCDQAQQLAKNKTDIIILDDSKMSKEMGALPALMVISAVNQRLIQTGLRFNSSLITITGQACGTHEVATALGFGASAILPLSVYYRACELHSSAQDIEKALYNFQKAVEKALMKTMGKFGLCTAESYIGGEFFEANFIDTSDPKVHAIFPNIKSPVGGASFSDMALSTYNWHKQMLTVTEEKDVPLLGLFKERSEGAGHSFGQMAVRTFTDMTTEPISFMNKAELDAEQDILRIPMEDDTYRTQSLQVRTPEQIDQHKITPAYRQFYKSMYTERLSRPATLRDVMGLPVNFYEATSEQEFTDRLSLYRLRGNPAFAAQGLSVKAQTEDTYQVYLHESFESIEQNATRYSALANALAKRLGHEVEVDSTNNCVQVKAKGLAKAFLDKLFIIPDPTSLEQVQAAHTITPMFATGAMSHGALVAVAHEAVATGTNIAGAMSNSGEGGEHSSRYNTVRASKIKQFASGRFGVWVGYLADPQLEEIEIKIAQGAKPGEGGQLPAKKVTVEIAAARGGTPGVELVSPPPHHDTYSIEDLGQLIHDAKAARVRVIVKLVSSEGIGTIAVGVAKAGADVINVAAGTGGTGAAQVTSLKNTGRVAELGIAEVHQALAANGLRDKVILRCSNAHQTGLDVIKSAMLGGDSFEFGTTALMMLKCVMAKNCNVKCPAGLTTNAEAYEGDPRALAQYFINLAHEVREILARIGFTSLREIRGRGDLLHLMDHPDVVGNLDFSALLHREPEIKIDNPIYLEADFTPDDGYIAQFKQTFESLKEHDVLELDGGSLNNCNKSTTGQFSIDVERYLNYELANDVALNHPHVHIMPNGRKVLSEGSVNVRTHNSAGQSFGAFNNSGLNLYHTGTCNDGVGKGASGGRIVVLSPNKVQTQEADANVLIGNFALFGATGGQLFVQGQAGDRFGVRNSGACAVIEGVGDFCCEYMTNGVVINLGSYGKGFGNGMSGGTAYQYDPEHGLPTRCSTDAVLPTLLSDAENTEQEQALLWHLEEHVAQTGSTKAKELLDNWQTVRNDFYVVIPLALHRHHKADNILKLHSRKVMIEELSVAWGENLLKDLRQAYKDNTPLYGGRVPSFGEQDSSLVCKYAISTGVLVRAVELTKKQKLVEHVDTIVKKLAITLDFKLLEMLFKDVKEALANYSDEALAILLAEKRVSDYKRALSMREVADSMALGTSVWILARDAEIRAKKQQLADQEQFESLEYALAKHYTGVIAQSVQVQSAA